MACDWLTACRGPGASGLAVSGMPQDLV